MGDKKGLHTGLVVQRSVPVPTYASDLSVLPPSNAGTEPTHPAPPGAPAYTPLKKLRCSCRH